MSNPYILDQLTLTWRFRGESYMSVRALQGSLECSCYHLCSNKGEMSQFAVLNCWS